MTKNTLKTILFLSVNSKESTSWCLQEEAQKIKTQLQLAGYGEVSTQFHGATRLQDIKEAISNFRPQIIHFSGHRIEQEGLFFEDEVGQAKLVSEADISDLFQLSSKSMSIECIILNSCYSKFQAEKISQFVDHVIGMSQEIGDQAAIEFSIGFYAALCSGKSFEFAYESGCNSIQLASLSGEKTPVHIRRTHNYNYDNYDDYGSCHSSAQSEGGWVSNSAVSDNDFLGLRIGNEHSDAKSLNYQACLYFDEGRYEDAEFLYQQALLETYCKPLGTGHPAVVTILFNLGVLYQHQGKNIEAETHYRQALSIASVNLGANHPIAQDIKRCLNSLLLSSSKKSTSVKPKSVIHRAIVWIGGRLRSLWTTILRNVRSRT